MNILLLELRNLRKSALAWGASISVVILLMLAFYPSMKSDAMQALANAKLEGIDPKLLAVLGLAEIPDFTIITNYFGYVLQFITIALMVFTTHQTVALLVKEESDGTIEYLYAKPVSRSNILVQKGLAHCITLLAILVACALTTVAGYLIFSSYTLGETIKEVSTLFSSILFIGLIFSAVGLLASALIRSSRSAAAITIVIVFGTFLLGAVSAVVTQLDFLIYFSPMDWVKTQKLMSEGIRPMEWVIGLILLIGCPLAAWLRYRRKDLLT